MKTKKIRKILNKLVGKNIRISDGRGVWTDKLRSTPDDDSYVVYNTVFSPEDVKSILIQTSKTGVTSIILKSLDYNWR